MAKMDDENPTIRNIAETVVDYGGAVDNFVKKRPLTALGISFLIGALLARKLLDQNPPP